MIDVAVAVAAAAAVVVGDLDDGDVPETTIARSSV